jgi:hypothetical protein
MWVDFLVKVVEGVLLAFAPVFASMLAAWLLAKARAAWAEFKAAQVVPAYILEDIARIVVNAAEQMKLAGLIEEKKDYALATAEVWLKDQGFNVNLDLIEAAIEAAVMQEFNKSVEAVTG